MLLDFNCIRCNAIQKFPPQTRELESGKVEEFVSCSKCRWELILVTYDDFDKLKEQKKLAKANARKLRRN